MPKITDKSIILASTSVRRQELLERLNLPFTIEASDYEEDLSLKMHPKKLAKLLSLGKAQAVARKHQSGIVIGTDTFVAFNNHLLGKPKDEADAKRMLQKLSGKSMDVITGMTIIDAASKKKVSSITITKVYFKKLTQTEIANYILSGEPLGKAGAFAVQGLGSALIRKVEGDFLSAMGLSLFALTRDLKKFGINVL